MEKIAKFLLGLLLFTIVSLDPIGWNVPHVEFPLVVSICNAQENDARENGKVDVQWFKEQMGISEKYAEETEGVYGISWAHFVAMVLMIGFIFATFVVVYLRNKRTRRIIADLLKEENQNGP